MHRVKRHRERASTPICQSVGRPAYCTAVPVSGQHSSLRDELPDDRRARSASSPQGAQDRSFLLTSVGLSERPQLLVQRGGVVLGQPPAGAAVEPA